MPLVSVRQINGPELAQFISTFVSGGQFSGFMQAYASASGWMGPNVLYISGSNQLILGLKAFDQSPLIPYSGLFTGSAASQAWTYDQILSFVGALSGTMTGEYVSLYRNQTVLDRKIFTGALGVGVATVDIDAVNLALLRTTSGVLATGISNVIVPNAVTTDGIQIISGEKIFTTSPLVVTPTDPSGAVPLSYLSTLSIQGAVYTTGDQIISGVKTFLQSPFVPLATQLNQPATLQQLNALGVSMGNVSGFAGVLSINGSTGAASGAVYLEGAGTVTVEQCGAIFYISGITAGLTQFYCAQIPLPSGVTGLSYAFPQGSGAFSTAPTITDALIVTGAGGAFFNHYVYNPSPSGFNVAFESPIPSNGFVYDFTAVPNTGASGFFGLQGQDGRAGASFNSRGVWQPGVVYSNLDWVYQPTVYASYACNQTHSSSSFNQPGGTGNFYWNILSSGTPGPSGAWVYLGQYNQSTPYYANYSVSVSGSTYGYTGSNVSINVNPIAQTGGWTVLAQKGDIGYFVNSGIITGNFVAMSLFIDPVVTGLNVAESFTPSTFQYTGYALGCVESGIQPDIGNFILTGRIYVREFLTNAKTILQTFTFDTGIYSLFSGNFAYTVTGLNRLGVDITSTLSGISKMSIGLFGFGT